MRDDPLADFLTARWGLHTRRFGRTFFLPNTHERWPLVTADLLSLDDELLAAAGARPEHGAAGSVLFSPGVHTRFGPPPRKQVGCAGVTSGRDIWAPEKVDQSRPSGQNPALEAEKSTMGDFFRRGELGTRSA